MGLKGFTIIWQVVFRYLFPQGMLIPNWHHLPTGPSLTGLEPADKTILYQEKNSAAVLSPEIQYELDYTEYIEELSEISAVYEAHACLWLGTCSDVEAEAEKLSQELQAVDVDKLVKKLNKMLGN